MPTSLRGVGSPSRKKKRQPPPVPPTPSRSVVFKPTPAQQENVIRGAKFGVVKPWEVPPPKPPPTPRRRIVSPQPTGFAAAIRPRATPWTVRSPADIPFRTGTILPTPPSIPDRPRPSPAQRTQRQRDSLYRDAVHSPVSGAVRGRVARSMTNEERRQYHEGLKPPPGSVLYGGTLYTPQRASFIPESWPGGHYFSEEGPVGRGITGAISGLPAMTNAIWSALYADIANPDRTRFPGSHLYDLAGELSAQTLLSAERVAGSPTLQHPFRPGAAAAYWKQNPIESLLTTSAVLAGPLRAASIGRLTSSIMEANPEMSLFEATRLARHESYRPGYLAAKNIEGGLPPRTMRATVAGGGEVPTVGKPLATTPLGRAAQAVYDRHSARIDPEARVIGRFSEQRRTVKIMAKRQNEAVEHAQLLVTQVAQEVGKYVRGTRRERLAALLSRRGADLGKQRARAAGLVYGLQGPAGETSLNVLHAARNDLQRILDEGGKEIPSRARVNVEKQMDRIDQTLERMGLGVDENAVHWTELRNLLHSLGWDPAAIEDTMQLEKHNARVWARQKPGRNPSDYLDAPDGRNMGAF